MAKKKRRKSGRGKGFGAVGRFAGGFFRLVFKILPLGLVVLLSGGLFWGIRSALYADTHFNIQKIVIHPPHDLGNTRRQALESQYLGKNILTVDLKKIAQEIQTDPGIEKAYVSRNFPSVLSVEIKKRVPVALVRFSPQSDFGLISEDGMILDVVQKSDSSELVVEAFSAGISRPKIGFQFKNRGFQGAIRFMEAYWKRPLSQREPVSLISLDHLGNVTVTLGAGPVIRLGKDPSSRLSAFEKMISLLDGEDRTKIEYVDLQFDDVILKRKGAKR